MGVVNSDECNICGPNKAKNLTHIVISSSKRDADVGIKRVISYQKYFTPDLMRDGV